MFRSLVCLILVLSQLGCRSVYRFECTSDPSEAGVLVGEEMVGETPCDVEIPEDSDWIQDSQIEFTFCLPDGQERKRVVDLSGRKPSNPLAESIAAPFFLVGGSVLVTSLADGEGDDDPAYDHDEDKGDHLVLGAAGLGIAGIGAGLYGLLGGKSESLEAHKVHMDFNMPVDEPESQTPDSQDPVDD